MKGKLRKAEHNEWLVEHEDGLYQVHPEDADRLIELDRVFDNLSARIAASPEVEFHLVQNQKLSGTVTYAKLNVNLT
jgi:hypothetical protein